MINGLLFIGLGFILYWAVVNGQLGYVIEQSTPPILLVLALIMGKYDKGK